MAVFYFKKNGTKFYLRNKRITRAVFMLNRNTVSASCLCDERGLKSMQKRGVKLNASRIGKDDDGFEDLDQFWDAAGEFKSPNKCPSSSPALA